MGNTVFPIFIRNASIIPGVSYVTFSKKQNWLISDNAGEYMSSVVINMLGVMDVNHVPIVPHISEENGFAERFNGTIMNAVRAALHTTQMS